MGKSGDDERSASSENDWWWIDYLENEFDPCVEKDLELLLQHSESDRDCFENFRLLRQWLSESDEAKEFPIEEQQIERLRSRIMDHILSDELTDRVEA